jgi:acyl carrier protein
MIEPPLTVIFCGGAAGSLRPVSASPGTRDYVTPGAFDSTSIASNAFSSRNFLVRPPPLNWRPVFAIRAPDLSRGEMGRPAAIRPAIAQRRRGGQNACPIRDLLMPSTFDTVANIISETCDIPRETIKPESHAINDLGIDSLDFLDIAFAIDKAFGIKMPLEQWTQEVNDGKATTEQYFQLNNLCTRIDELVAAKGA